MARIRSTKPEFCTSEQIVSCSRDARLLFLLMWCFCDDGGVHPASAQTLKMQVFPGDDISTEQVARLIDELLNAKDENGDGLLLAYEVEGRRYWLVTGWFTHQKIDRPSYRYPMPNGRIPTCREEAEQWSRIRRPFAERSTNHPRTIAVTMPNQSTNSDFQTTDKSPFDERSQSARRILDDGHPPEGRGRGEERKGKEGIDDPRADPRGPAHARGELAPAEPSPSPPRGGNLPTLEQIQGKTPTYHATQFHPRFQEVREYIVRRLPNLGRQNATEVNRWLIEGADPEKDIIPTVDNAIEFKRGDIGSFRYFTRGVESSRDVRREMAEQDERLRRKYAEMDRQDAEREAHDEAG